MDNDICPECSGYVERQTNGELLPHQRYADGAGWQPDRPHTLIPCEGGAPLSIPSREKAGDASR